MADERNNLVSMLDLQADTEELMGFNPEADANAMLPPIPAGLYAVKVRFTGEDPEKRWQKGVWGKDEQVVYYTSVTAEVYNAGDLDGRTVRELVSTYVMARSGTNAVQGLLQALGYAEQIKTCRTRSQLVILLNQALADDAAPAEANIDWEATEPMTPEEREVAKAKGRKVWRMQGMTRFPKDGEGNYIPVINHEGVDCRAFNVIKNWVTVGGKSATTNVAQAPAPVAPRVAQAPPQAAPRPVQASPVAQAPQGPPVPPRARQAAPQPVPAGVKR